MTHAGHSSSVIHEDTVPPGGEPGGCVIDLEDGKKIDRSGDSGVLGDMRWIGSYYGIGEAEAAPA